MIDSAKISIHYIAKLEYTGSYQGMRYMMKKKTIKEKIVDEQGQEKENKKDSLLVYTWPEPLSFAKTDSSKIITQEFAFSQEGKEEAVKWLNEFYEREYLIN